MENLNKMDIVIYSRVSTTEQDESSHISDIEKEFDLNLNEISIFRENVSAYNQDKIDKRYEFQKVNKLIKNKSIESIYVWDIDRIFRNRKKLVEFFELCHLHKVKVFSYRQKWLSELNNIPEPWNEIMSGLMTQILGWLAEEESNKKSERVLSKIDKSSGKTKSVYGNDWGRKNISQTAINKVLKFHNEGMSYRKICDNVKITDHNNNQKNIALGSVHKIIAKMRTEQNSQNGQIL
jgi:DNA invertase Pin-like site-specific DNA recombinase